MSINALVRCLSRSTATDTMSLAPAVVQASTRVWKGKLCGAGSTPSLRADKRSDDAAWCTTRLLQYSSSGMQQTALQHEPYKRDCQRQVGPCSKSLAHVCLHGFPAVCCIEYGQSNSCITPLAGYSYLKSSASHYTCRKHSSMARSPNAAGTANIATLPVSPGPRAHNSPVRASSHSATRSCLRLKLVSQHKLWSMLCCQPSRAAASGTCLICQWRSSVSTSVAVSASAEG